MRNARRRIQRLAPALAALALASLLACGTARAESGGKEPSKPKRVFVPVDDWNEVVKAEPDGILLTWDEYRKLRELAQRNRKADGMEPGAPPPVSLLSASYRARLDGKIFRVDATLEILSRRDGVSLMPLRLGRTAVAKASLDGDDAPLHRPAGSTLELVVRGKGRHRLEMSFVAPVEEGLEGRTVRLALPPAPASRMTAVLPGDLEVVTEPSITETRRLPARDATEAVTALGGAEAYTLRFRAKAIEEEKTPIVEVKSALALTIGGVARAEWTLHYHVHKAPLDTLRWTLPEGWTLASFEAPDALTWGETDGTLEVRFRAPKEDSFVVRLGLEDDARPGPLALPVLEPEGVHLHDAFALVFIDKRFTPRLDRLDGARVMDAQKVTYRDLPLFRAFRYVRPDPEIRLDLLAVEGRTRCFARHFLRVEENEARLESRFLYRTLEGELFGLEIGLPQGYTLDEAGLQDARGEIQTLDDGKRLQVRFAKPLPAASHFRIRLALRSPLDVAEDRDTRLPLPAATSGASEEEGVLAVSAPPSLRVTERTTEGLAPLNPEDQQRIYRLYDPQMRLAYRYRRLPWTGEIEIRRESPQVSLTTDVLYLFRGSAVHTAARLRYQVRKAGADRLAFLLPGEVGEAVLVQGKDTKPAFRKRVPEGWLWTVPLQSEALGVRELFVSFVSSPADGDPGARHALPWIRGASVSSESGTVAVEAAGDVEVEVQPAGLEEIEPADLPDLKALGGGGRVLFAYKFVRPAWSLSAKLKRHETLETGRAVVLNVSGTVQVDPEGGEKASVVYTVRETGLQDLLLEMHEGFELWSLTVDGAGVKPAHSANLLIVPLTPQGVRDRTVKVVYRRAANTPSLTGRFEARLPTLGVREGDTIKKVPVLASSMDIRAPEDYRLISAFGAMTPVFETPGPRSLLRRAYEKFSGLALLLVLAVVLGLGLIYYNEPVSRFLEAWVIPNRRAINAAVAGTAALVILVVLFMSFLDVMMMSRGSKSAPGVGMEERSAGAEAPGAEGLQTYGATDESEPPLEDPVLKDAEISGRFGGRAKLDSKKRKGEAARADDRLQREREKEMEEKRKRLEQPGQAGLPANEPRAPEKPSPSEDAGEGPYPTPAPTPPSTPTPTPDAGDDARPGFPAGFAAVQEDLDMTGLFRDTRGLRTLAVDLDAHGRAFRFHGEGGLQRAGLYLLGRNAANALGFLLFLAGVMLPLWLLRDARGVAVAVLAAVLLGLSLFPEIVPAFSGICNLGVAGILFGLVLYALVPGVGWLRKVVARWALPAAVLLAVVLLVPAAASAGETPADRQKETSRIYIPYDPGAAEGGIEIEKVFLPYAEFLRLWDLAFPEQAVRPARPPAPYAHVSVQYVGEVGEGWFTGGAVFRIETFGEGPVEVPLGLKGAMVEEARADGKKAALRETKRGYAFAAPEAGSTTLEVSFRARAEERGKAGRIAFGLHPIPTATALINLGDPVLTAKVPTALGGVEKQRGPGGEVVTAYLGASDRMLIEYRPKGPEGTDAFATLKARSTSTLSLEPGVQRLFASCAFEVVGKAREKFRFEIAKDLKVLKVEGPPIRAWGSREEGGKRILEIHLQKPEDKAARFQVEAFRTLPDAAPSGEMPLFRPLGCLRETGRLAVECPGHLRLIVEERENLSPVDPGAFSRRVHPVEAAYQYARRPLTFAYRLDARPVRLGGELALASMIGPEDARLAAYLVVSSSGVPAYRFSASLPEGYRVDGVKGVFGPSIKDWVVETGAGEARRLRVILDKGLSGRMGIVLWMSRKISLAGGPRDFEIPAVLLDEAKGYSGHIVVLTFPGIRLESRDLENVQSVQASRAWYAFLSGFCGALKRRRPSLQVPALGFKFDGVKIAGTITAETLEPVLSCTWTLHQRIQRDSVETGFYFTYRAEKAPAKSLAFTLPAWVPKERVVIPDFPGKREVERVDLPGGRVLYRVGLQRGFLGTWKLAAHVKLPLEAGDGFTEVQVPRCAPASIGDGVVKGFVLVENAEADTELRPAPDIAGLERIGAEAVREASAFPPGVTAQDVTFAYRAREAWSAAFRLETLEMERGVELEVEYIDLLTVVRRQGDSLNRARFKIVNRARQFLAVTMPDEARLLSLLVDGRAAKPARDEAGGLLVPLPRRSAADPSILLEMIWGQPYRRILTADRFTMQHPHPADPSIKVGRVFWSLRLPRGYAYRFTGDMEELDVPTQIEVRKTERDLQQVETLVEEIGQASEKKKERLIENLDREVQRVRRQVLSNEAMNLRYKKQGDMTQKIQVQEKRTETLEQEVNRLRSAHHKQVQQQQALKAQRDIGRNAARFVAGQREIEAKVWNTLAPEEAGWNFREQPRVPRTQQGAPRGGGGFRPSPAAVPAGLREGARLDFPLPGEGMREFHFMKEGREAELKVQPFREGAMGWAGTLVKLASLTLIFLAALLTGLLREAKGWPYRRLWIWLVLLVACGASLASWPFALIAGGIAAFVIHRVNRSKETEAEEKPGYAL